MMTPLPDWVVAHLPHTSRAIPTDIHPALLLSDAKLERDLDRLRHHQVEELLTQDLPRSRIHRADVSRVVVDVEHCENDEHELMTTLRLAAGKEGRRDRLQVACLQGEAVTSIGNKNVHSLLDAIIGTPARASQWTPPRVPRRRRYLEENRTSIDAAKPGFTTRTGLPAPCPIGGWQATL